MRPIKNYFPNLLCQKLIKKIISACSQLRYSSALNFAKAIGEECGLDSTASKPYIQALSKHKKATENKQQIEETFNHCFFAFDLLIHPLTHLISLSQTNKWLIMQDLTKERLIRLPKKNL